MSETEFLKAVQAVYQREIAKGRTAAMAHKAAETFRSNLICSLARKSS